MKATIIIITSVAKAMKVLRKLGCCLQIEVGLYRACVEMVVIKLFCLVKSQKLLSKMWLYSIHDVISYTNNKVHKFKIS